MAVNPDRRRFLEAAASAIAGLEFAMVGSTKSLLHGIGAVADGPLSALQRATTWLNSQPLTAAGLRGKVVLADFWTYTCINWLRTLPYVRAWAEKYRDHGLVVIGVHTPEFGFEHDLENVRRAVTRLRVDYPVAVDNDYAIWNGFANQYWPALYFLDAHGVIRHGQFGEGSYDMAEMTIQRLLAENGAGGIGRELVQVDAQGVEVAADWDSLASPENYLGTDRTEHFVSGAPSRVNEWSVAGDWTRGAKALALNAPNGRIIYRFHARDVNLVMSPAAKGKVVPYRVRIDGQPPGQAHGGDVDAQGQGTVTEQRLYQLIRQARPIVDRQFDIEFTTAGVEAFAFTFG